VSAPDGPPGAVADLLVSAADCVWQASEKENTNRNNKKPDIRGKIDLGIGRPRRLDWQNSVGKKSNRNLTV
jgi:hypothetical protein